MLQHITQTLANTVNAYYDMLISHSVQCTHHSRGASPHSLERFINDGRLQLTDHIYIRLVPYVLSYLSTIVRNPRQRVSKYIHPACSSQKQPRSYGCPRWPLRHPSLHMMLVTHLPDIDDEQL
jgi:hypothetical protein